MAKFLDKKERVYDLKLTTYGKRLLSKGTFKPGYYAFFDGEILYDKDYARSGDRRSQRGTLPELSGTAEPQNDIHKRIKNETQYLEGFVNFREVEEAPEYNWSNGSSPAIPGWLEKAGMDTPPGITTLRGYYSATGEKWLEEYYTLDGTGFSDEGPMGYFRSFYSAFDYLFGYVDPLSKMSDFFDAQVNADFFRFESSIGDAVFSGKNIQHAPAWKVVTLQGQISSSASEDISHFYPTSEGRNEQKIPQINIELNYRKKVQEPDFVENPNNIPQLISKTEPFADRKVIELVRDDLVVYADEINTMILTENFDIEVFESEDVDTALPATGKIKRATSKPDAGDKITISDGVTSATFEFIVDGGTPAEGNVGVVISSEYEYLMPPGGGFNNRFGTMENLVAAINQSANSGWEDGGIGGTARCNGSIDKCYTGTHTLNITANDGDHGLVFDVPVAIHSTPIIINLTNHVGGTLSNQPISIDTDADGNFTVEGFSGGKNKITTSLSRKYFQKDEPQVVNGMMVSQNKNRFLTTEFTTDAVEYYFDIFTDNDVDQNLACRGANIFNKESYYIDLDFECSPEDTCADNARDIFYDIYGNAIGDTSDIC